MKYLVDFRCPKCNKPILGSEEVNRVSKLPPKHFDCPHCKTQILLNGENVELGDLYYYDFDEYPPTAKS